MAIDTTKNTGQQLEAKKYFSGFKLAHDTYNAISSASDGSIYYILSSESLETGGRFYEYKPCEDRIVYIGDLTELCGEGSKNAVPQGKSHVSFYERQGKLYFGTHVGFYELVDGIERMPENPPNGVSTYPGGHLLSYDLASREVEDLLVLPGGEGILSMTMDLDRAQIYGITWPTGRFFHYDTEAKTLQDLGPVSFLGEAGTPGKDFRTLCRSLFVDPRCGSVYFSTADGAIFRYDPEQKKLLQEEVHLRLDYFGQYDPTRPGSMAYNWRKIFWHESEQVAYGVHGNSGYLFRFDPRKKTVELVERIVSEPSRKSGMFDQFSYGYLGFDHCIDNDTIYYLTGGPIYKNGKRVEGVESISKGAAKGLENLHLVTFRIPDRQYIDHGPILYADGAIPTYVNSIAIGKDGYIYTLARFDQAGTIIQDLIKIKDPLQG
ncbi:hypothetical protein SAMN05192553_11071 [Cyclobacterium xiamenense]|uniref:Uncharacterized protein n=1 Tax=Cyclobacterium xiamenense TaxID=1297121 RepID=A0A1H7BHJ2_9BACT|nr:hypothetical protein [Cyclobacterium xiamenense]SEJ73700.1 hypothetical protein SAMN05192553_11071 [Cyclobacterium xiamenense]